MSTVVKPKYSQVYTFSTNLVSCEIWVDENLVVGHGQMEGQIQLSAGSWSAIKILYRVTNATGTVP